MGIKMGSSVNNLKKQIVNNFNNLEKIEGIEVGEIDGKTLYAFPTDAHKEMTWDEAKKYTENLGGGWKLPNKEEMLFLYANKKIIGGFKSSNYWSSSEFDDNFAYVLNFGDGNWYFNYNDFNNYVRCVRVTEINSTI